MRPKREREEGLDKMLSLLPPMPRQTASKCHEVSFKITHVDRERKNNQQNL